MMKNISGWTPREYDQSRVLSLVVTAHEKPHELASLLHALRAQTHEALEVVVVHDGPPSGDWYWDLAPVDRRFRLVATDRPAGLWGYPLRETYEAAVEGDYIGDLCDDDWVCPVYAECLVEALEQRRDAQVSYCDHVRHLEGWKPYEARFRRLEIGIGGWIGRRSTVQEFPTPRPYHGESDGERADVMNAAGVVAIRVPRTLIVYG